jgi:hypothetical protein
VTRRFSGPRFVLGLYAFLVTFSVVAGVLFVRVVEEPTPPRLFFVVPLPPTELGFAVYGGVTIAVVLGVPLLLVQYASRYDDAAVE